MPEVPATHPGEHLGEILDDLNISFAKTLGLDTHRTSSGQALDMTPEFWLRLQLRCTTPLGHRITISSALSASPSPKVRSKTIHRQVSGTAKGFLNLRRILIAPSLLVSAVI